MNPPSPIFDELAPCENRKNRSIVQGETLHIFHVALAVAFPPDMHPFCFSASCPLNSCGKPFAIEAPAESGGQKNALHQLRAENCETTLGDPLLAPSNIGIKVVSVTTGEILFESGAGKLYHPASTMKLLTAADCPCEIKTKLSLPHNALCRRH